MFKHKFLNYFRRKKYLNLLSSSKNRKLLVISLILIVLIVSFVIPSKGFKTGMNRLLSMAGVYTEEVKEVTLSNGNNPGNFIITKSADWIGENKALLTIDLKTVLKTSDKHRDIVLIIDNSGSMAGDKFNKVKEDTKELIDILLSDSNNSVALITFNSTSQILSNFSKNASDLKGMIDNISETGNTNYNAALTNLDTLLSIYTEKENTDLISLFITDGCPGEDTPSEVGTYHILKDKYSFLNLIGIQYEMGTTIKQELVKITDRQFVADMKSLNNVLVEAAVNPVKYDSFQIDEYLDTNYFTVSNVSDITTSLGEVTLDNNHITWNLGNLTTGLSQQMTIKLDLVNNLADGYYPVNSSLIVTGSLEEEPISNSYVNTPVLSTNYTINYISNAPSGCNVVSNSTESHRMYSTVSKKTNVLSCAGYLFKGWHVEDTNIKYINDDTFIMPSRDINIRGTWTKKKITVTMDGTVHEKTTLYKVLKNEAENNGLAREYTGDHQDSMDVSKSTQKIYHWYATNDTEGTSIQDKNNVIFAGHCWQMIRTTDTGGVKMIYNGEVEDEQCLNTRGAHVGYRYYSLADQRFNDNYWYGSDYTYDSTNNVFSIAGTTEQASWNATTASGLIGKYTCKSTTETATCSNLYLVESYNDTSTANVIPISRSTSNYSQFGGVYYNINKDSPAYVGYKYGDVYISNEISSITSNQSFTTQENLLSFLSLDVSYWYADSISYDSVTGKYSLDNPYQITAITDYPSLVGKYTFRNSNQSNTGTSVCYIVGVNNTTMYYKLLQSGNLLSAYEPIIFGDSITDNGNGTYILNNPISVSLSDWYTNYANYNNKYTCNDSSTTCTDPRYLTSTSTYNYKYLNVMEKIMIGKTRSGTTLTDTLLLRKEELLKNSSNYSDYKYTCNTDNATCTESNLMMIIAYNNNGFEYGLNYYFGSSVTWDGANYTLVDPIENFNDLNDISTHHYICLNYGEKSCSEVGYIFYYNSSQNVSQKVVKYIILKNGVSTVSKAMEDMFTKNTTNSYIKIGIDAWYKHFMLPYDNYIEDTIFCNDRSIRNLGGWNDGGTTFAPLQFKERYDTSDLSCTNTTDKFSVSNSAAQLTYKVGLMSSPEMNILNNNNVRKTGKQYWLASPSEFDMSASINGSFNNYVMSDGRVSADELKHSFGVRPAISLIPGIEYSSGNGSMANPYIIDIE